MLESQDAIAGPGRVRWCNTLQRLSPGLDDEIVDRKQECRTTIGILLSARIQLFAYRQQPINRDIGCEVEMRNGLLGLHETCRNGPAHAIERDFIVRRVTIERLDLLGAPLARGRGN